MANPDQDTINRATSGVYDVLNDREIADFVPPLDADNAIEENKRSLASGGIDSNGSGKDYIDIAQALNQSKTLKIPKGKQITDNQIKKLATVGDLVNFVAGVM